MDRRRALTWLALAVVGLAACRVDVAVGVRVHADGSGVVRVTATLDADAVQAVDAGGAKLDDAVRLGDLAAAGWTVLPWRRARGGSAHFVIVKRFARLRDLPSVLREVSGSSRVLRGVAATRSHGWLATRSSVRATVGLDAISTGVLSDPELAGRLRAAGVDPEAIAARLRSRLSDALHVRLSVSLPGGGHATAVPRAGGRAELRASTSVLDVRRLAWVGAGGVLALAAALVPLVGRRRSRSRSRSG